LQLGNDLAGDINHTISIPAIGKDIFGLPGDVCAQIMIE